VIAALKRVKKFIAYLCLKGLYLPKDRLAYLQYCASCGQICDGADLL